MGKYDPHKHHRQSIRLKGWDYRSAGYYFVTICTHQRKKLFGTVTDGGMVLSALGGIVREEWLKTAVVRQNIALDEFIIMPNHFHGIIEIVEASGSLAFDEEIVNTGRATGSPLRENGVISPKKGSLGAIMAQFKAMVVRRHRREVADDDAPIWQRGYYDRIVRNERELNTIQQYIKNNPVRWAEDRDNLDVLVGRMNGR